MSRSVPDSIVCLAYSVDVEVKEEEEMVVADREHARVVAI